MAKKKRGRELTTQVVIRFPQDLFSRLEAYTARLNAERPGLTVTRADTVRMLVHERLTEIEAEQKTK